MALKILTLQNRSRMLVSNPAVMTKNSHTKVLTPGFFSFDQKGQTMSSMREACGPQVVVSYPLAGRGMLILF
jgi:hypothetical protein